MEQEIELDVRGLEAPEPLERVLDALSRLQPGECLCMLIDREPRPLYNILTRNNFVYEATQREDFDFEIRIRHKT